jgi:hypothetical protein
MKWREIGPMRAGRTSALAGVPSEPAIFNLGAVNGGVWKTISQYFKIIMDPRVKTSAADLQAQFDPAKSIYDDLLRATTAIHENAVLRAATYAETVEFNWCPRWDSNPCYRRERAVSWAGLDDGDWKQ